MFTVVLNLLSYATTFSSITMVVNWCRVDEVLNGFWSLKEPLANSQIVAYWNFRYSNIVFPLTKYYVWKRADQKVKARDGKCEKWELSSESEVLVWKFPGISIVSAVETSVIQYFDSVSQKHVCHSAAGDLYHCICWKEPTCTQVLGPAVTVIKLDWTTFSSECCFLYFLFPYWFSCD